MLAFARLSIDQRALAVEKRARTLKVPNEAQMGNQARTRHPVIKLATRRFEVKVRPLRGGKVKRDIVRCTGPNADRDAVPVNVDGSMDMAA